MKAAALFALLFAFLNAKTQTWEWAIAPEKQVTGMGTGYSLASAGSNDIYVAASPIGHSYCGQQFTCAPAGGGLIARHNPQGKVLWLVQVPDQYCAISSDANGDLYAGGVFYGNADFCGNGNPDISLTQTSTAGPAAYIARYSSTGALIWARKWDKWPSSRVNVLKTDRNGNSYVAFQHDATISGSSGYVLGKYDNTGKLIWESDVHFNTCASAIDADSDGNCYVTGMFTGTIQLGSNTLAGNKIFICKYDKKGQVVWAKTAGNKGACSSAICIDNQGGFYLAGGYSIANPEFGNISLSTPSSGGFIARYDTAGNTLWVDGYVGGARGIATDLTGNCYLAGIFAKKITLGLGQNSVNLISQKLDDLFVAKFDIWGNLVWAESPGGSLGGTNIAHAIVRDAAGNCYITGAFTSTTVFGNSTLSIPLSSYHAMYLAKINDLTFNPVSVTEQGQFASLLQVFPNPGDGVFTLSYTSANNADHASFILRNVAGQLIWQQHFPLSNRQLEEQIDLGTLPRGLYLLELVSGSNRETRKLVIN